MGDHSVTLRAGMHLVFLFCKGKNPINRTSCLGKKKTRERFQGEGGRQIAPHRAAADDESGAPAEAGSPKSRNRVFRFGFGFGTVSGIVRGVLLRAFWESFGHHVSALGLPWRVFWASLRTLGLAGPAF